MKKALFIFFGLLALAVKSEAQNIILSERTPELKSAVWLQNREPATAELTYIEFYHSTNPASTKSLNLLKSIAADMNGRLCILIISQESKEKVAAQLTPYVSEHISVGLDSSGKIFSGFGVSYIPFGVLVDSKDRALWMGNSLQLTTEFIDKISK